MQRYILARAWQAVFSLLAVLAIVFLLARNSGNPVDLMLPLDATAEDRAMLTESLGLDKPQSIQFVIYLGEVISGDFGASLRTRRPAMAMIAERVSATLQLAIGAMLVGLLVGIPIGVYSAVRRGRVLDFVARLAAVLGQSVPIFWLGIVLIYLFSVTLRLLPTSGDGSWAHLVLPMVSLGWYTSSGLMRLTRSAMLDVLGAEYVKLARVKGLSHFKVVWKHAFKNAAVPVLTYSMVLFVTLLSGTIVVETVFAWPGLGRLMYDSVLQRDFPVIQAIVLLMSAAYIVVNLFVDVLYAYVNPKIRYGE